LDDGYGWCVFWISGGIQPGVMECANWCLLPASWSVSYLAVTLLLAISDHVSLDHLRVSRRVSLARPVMFDLGITLLGSSDLTQQFEQFTKKKHLNSLIRKGPLLVRVHVRVQLLRCLFAVGSSFSRLGSVICSADYCVQIFTTSRLRR
jgi:hypothetical protein